MRYYVTVLAAVTILIGAWYMPVAGEEDSPQLDVAIEYETVAAGKSALDVEQTIHITNQGQDPLTDLKLQLPVAELEDLRVTRSGSGDLDYTADTIAIDQSGLSLRTTQLDLDFGSNAVSTDGTLELTIGYTAPEAVRVRGDNRAAILPRLDGGVGAEWELQLDAPRKWPDMDYRPPWHSLSRNGDHLRFEFSSDEVQRDILGVSFSKSVVQEYTQRITLRNRSILPRRQQIAIPSDAHQQTTHISSIKPKPDHLRTDQDGNTVAEYRLGPRASREVTITSRLATQQLRYDNSHAGERGDIPTTLETYTIGNDMWPTQTAIGEQATRTIDPEAGAWENTQSLHDFVRDEMTLNPEAPQDQDTLDVFEERTGNARQLADVLVTMLRSQGIPARVVEGDSFMSGLGGNSFRKHFWTEAYVGGMGWMTVDPVWSGVMGRFGYSSPDHTALAFTSNQQQHKEYQVPDVDDSAVVGGLPEPSTDSLRAEAWRYIIFPGVSIDRVEIRNTTGRTLDNVTMGGDEPVALAPRSTFLQQEWRLTGMDNFSVAITAPDQELDVTSRRQWWPLLLVSLILVAAGVIQFYRYRMRRYVHRWIHGHSRQ